MKLDCFGVTKENWAICMFSLIEYGDSVVLVILTANLLKLKGILAESLLP